MRTLILILTSLMLLCAASYPQTSVLLTTSSIVADYFVSATGSDSNTGSLNSPFQTLDKARRAVAANANKGTKPLVVMIRGNGGTIYNSSTTFNGTGDSGSNTAPITYEAYPGESPVLSGGIHVTGWAKSTTGNCNVTLASGSSCWKTTLPAGTTFFERMWYNGLPRMRPRMGATAANLQGTYGISTGAITGTGNGCASSTAICGFNYTSGDPVANWSSCQTNKCEVWSFAKWSAPVNVISSITTGSKTITFTCTTNSNCNSTNAGTGGPFLNHERYVIENMLENFKFAGQWYLDASVSPMVMYYISNPGEDPTSDTVEVGQNNQVITASNISNVTFAGIAFKDDGYDIASTGFISIQLDPSLTNALVSCDSCTNINFFSDIFANTTSIGLRIIGNSNNIDIDSNEIYDIGAYGLQIGVDPQSTSCSGSCSDSEVPRNITVENNWINYTGRFLPSADGIMIGLSNNVDILFNDIGYTYDKGIEVCKPASHTCNSGSATVHDVTIQGNDIHNIIQGVMTDAAGFYASTEDGVNNVFTGNRIHDVNGAIVQNASEPDSGVHGVYLDDFTGLWSVTNNLVYRITGSTLHMNDGPSGANKSNTLSNNILVNSLILTATSACVDIQEPPDQTILEFTYKNNICSQDLSANNLVNDQQGPPTSNTTAAQSFIQNIYAFAGTPKFNVVGNSNILFASWQGFGEDTTGTISTPAGFKAPGNCAGGSTIPVPGVCDDFTFTNGTGPGHGFVAFSETFGTTGVSGPAIIATFPEATLPLNQF